MLIVQVCDFGSDGDAHYRMHDPMRRLGRIPGVTTVDCHFYSRHLPELARLADVLVLQFVNDWDFHSLCIQRRAAGKLTVFEANDYFFDLHAWNPLATAWHNRINQELYLQLLAAADGVQTSTPELARRWRERGARQVAVFANYLADVPALSEPGDRPLTIGWGGSPGHLADWYAVAPMLQAWLDAHPEVNLAVMTSDAARDFFRLPPERYHFQPFGSLMDYLQFLGRLDIGLAPLLPSDYNRCRSNVKFIEYASRGVAGIYADLEPYRDSVIAGETGLIYRTPGEMMEQLETLRADPALRAKIRRQAHERVARRSDDPIAERLAWYRSLMQTPPTAAPLPQEIVSAAIRDEGYYRVAVQEPEQTLIQAINGPATPESVKTLTALCERQPRYLVALQHQGRTLNGRREYPAALAVLERARQLAPESSHTLSEIGRSHFLLGDLRQAREALEESIRLNPHYLPAWQYLLRLLDWKPDPTGPAWAQRAEQLFPACYPIALLGVKTYPPGQVVDVLLRLLDQYVPTLWHDERPTALALFRETIQWAVQKSPDNAGKISLLRRACELFPESSRLAGELGALLYRAGEFDEAIAQQCRALALRQRAQLANSEWGSHDGLPVRWLLAQHIQGFKSW